MKNDKLVGVETIPVNHFVGALAIEHNLDWLGALLAEPHRAATWNRLAHVLGLKDYRAINARSGHLGRRVAERFGLGKPEVNGVAAWNFMLVKWSVQDGGNTRFELLPNVAKALCILKSRRTGAFDPKTGAIYAVYPKKGQR
jgi:hypothetical protein